MTLETLSILEQLARDKGLDKKVLIDALKAAVEIAARKRYPSVNELQSEFNESTGEVEIYLEKTVVKDVIKPDEEISLKEATSFSEDAPTSTYSSWILGALPFPRESFLR